MTSIPLREVLRKAASKIGDAEDLIWGDLDSATSQLTKVLLETIAESEVEQRVGVRLYERGETRSDHRNGYRKRKVQLSYQTLEINIPRLRGQGYVPSYLEPCHRAIDLVEGWVEKAFLSGLSRSEVCRLMEMTTGCRPSDGVIRRVQKELDNKVNAFKDRLLFGRYEYLFLDAAWAKDIVGITATRICILTAVGITYGGQKEILGFERVPVESETTWRGFLNRLVSRGMKPSDIKLVISDEHKGISKALWEVLGDVPQQLCWAHRCRNVRKQVYACDRREVIAGLREVYKASNLTAARDAYRRWRIRWKDSYPTVVSNLDEDIARLLAFYKCPELHWEYIRTSNPIERVFLELRRQQFGCGAFANREACNRAVYRVYWWLNGLWADKNIWIQRKRKQKILAKVA